MTTINVNEVVHKEDDEIIVTHIKTGKKREFQRMMKQNRYCIITDAPRRLLRSRKGTLSPKKVSGNKRKIQVSNDVVQDEVERCNISQKPVIIYTRRSKAPVPVDVGIEDRDTDVIESISSSNSNTELLDISNNVELKKISSISLTKLLETNLLQGLHVRYVKGIVIKKRNPGEADLEGIICGTNIKCFCNKCKGEEAVTPSAFELHAGGRNKRPSDHIRLDNGRSLKDVLNLCKNVPLDSLEQQIKIAIGLADAQEGSIPPQSAEHTSGDCEALILNRSTDESDDACSTSQIYDKHIKTSSTECFFCRGVSFTTEFGPFATIYCDQCEKEYHIKCLKEHGIDDLKSVPEEAWFCSTECRDVYSDLHKLLNDGAQSLMPPLLSIIRKKQKSIVSETRSDPTFTWRLLNRRMGITDEQSEKWLSNALRVFNNKFLPITIQDIYSRSKPLIPTILKPGKTIPETYYGGVYCAVLIQDSEVVCAAALFRIFGRELAELPFVATAAESEGKGFGQALVGCIINLMASMHVKEVLLPTTSSNDTQGFWKNKFGFEVLNDEQLRVYKQNYALMEFVGSNMLHKSLLPKPERDVEVGNI